MDLYAIHKSFLDMQSKYSDNSDMTDPEQSRSREEMARLSKLINMAILQGKEFSKWSEHRQVVTQQEHPALTFPTLFLIRTNDRPD